MGVENPQELSTEEYYKKYADYLFLKKEKRDFYIGILRQILIESQELL